MSAPWRRKSQIYHRLTTRNRATSEQAGGTARPIFHTGPPCHVCGHSGGAQAAGPTGTQTFPHSAPASMQRISLPSAGGPHAPPPPPARPVCLHNPTARTWPWKKPFLADLLAWLRALQWMEDTGTLSLIELALHFEEPTLPAHPRLNFRNTHYHYKRGLGCCAWRYAHFRDWSKWAHSTQPKS